MSETILDDRDPAITYVDGVWRKGGNSREYRETSSWSISNEATATIDFYGNSIQVIGTIHRRADVPDNATLNLAFVLQGESSSAVIAQNRARFEQPHPPKYSVQLYGSPQLTDNSVKRQLVIRNLTPDNQGFLCLDAVYIGGYTVGPGPGQSGIDSPPSSSTSTTSSSAPPSSSVTTSASSESGSPTVAPNTTTSVIPSASSESSSTLFAPAATDESSSLPVEGSSGSDGSRRTDSSQADSKSGDKNRHTVPGVLGGLVGLLALGILCWFIFVRRRNKRKVFQQDQEQKFASPYDIAHPANLEMVPSGAGSETHLLTAIRRSNQNNDLPPSSEGMQGVDRRSGGNIGSSGLNAVSAPTTKSAWNSSTAGQHSGSGFDGNSAHSMSRQEDDSVSPPPYTTSV